MIVIDGASTDDTASVVEKHRDIIALYRSEPDASEGHGFNKGFLAAHGRIIKPVTDDDYFFPDAMRQTIALMEQHPEVAAVVCGGEAYVFDEATGRKNLAGYQWLPRPFRHGDPICGIGLILTRKCIDRVGLFDPSTLAVDTDYMSRLVASGVDFRYLDIKLYAHVEYPHSGQRNLRRTHSNQVRVLLRYGEWELAGRYQLPDFRAGLGLDSVRGGASLAAVTWYLERMRRGPFRPLLNLLALPFLVLDAGIECAPAACDGFAANTGDSSR